MLTFNGTTDFINNSALLGDGGAIYTHSTEFTFNGTNNFINNSANGEVSFGGAILSTSCYSNIVFSFTGNNNFIGNSATFGCGAIFAQNILLTFTVTSIFNNLTQQNLVVPLYHLTMLYLPSMELTTLLAIHQTWMVVQPI